MKKKSFIRRLFSKTMLLANIAAIFWLGLCYAASFVNPGEFKYIALFSLTSPFAIAANFFFVIFWLLSSKKIRIVASLIALILCYKMIPAIYGYHFFAKNDWTKKANSFKLMSWNTHGMGIYVPMQEKQLAEGIVNIINREAPDILCLPEFSVNNIPSKNQKLRKLINENHYKEYRINTDHILNKKVVVGTAILSKYPIAAYKVYDLNPEIYLLQCDVQVRADDVVRVFVLHLHSFGLSDEDKEFIEKVKRNNENIQRSRPLFSRFNNAYVTRALEADKVADVVRKSNYPTVICGDFNDLPFSYTYSTIRGDLTDAFTKKGRGFGRTYNQIIPTLRIDHILYSAGSLQLNGFKTIRTSLSDHNPVVANFELVNKSRTR